MVPYYIFNNLGVQRNSLRCIFAKSVWIESEWILEIPFHPSHYISAELSRESLFALVRSSTLKTPLCCHRYKTITAFPQAKTIQSPNSYPSFGQNFRQASRNVLREDFGSLIHRSITFGSTATAKSCWWWMGLTTSVVFAGILMPLMMCSSSIRRTVPGTGGYSRSDSFKTCVSEKHKRSVS